MQIQDFNLAVGEVIPELHSELAEDMNIHASAGSVIFDEIGKSGWESRDVAKTLEQISLLARGKAAEEIKDFNGDEQPRVAHLESSPNSRSHCSGVSQRPGDLSSIFRASSAA